jgi:hypothetical protein
VTIGCALKASLPKVQLKPITSSRDFLDAFLPELWMGCKFVVFVDEFSELHRATPEVLNEVVRTFSGDQEQQVYLRHSKYNCLRNFQRPALVRDGH